MDNLEFVNAIKSFSLFKKIDEHILHSLIDLFEIEHFPEKTVIINQGDYGDKIYFILSGKAEAYFINKEGEDVILATLHKGSYFGELALLIDGFRNCFVRSKVSCKLLSLTKSNFDALLDQFPSISRMLNELLSQRLGETLHLITEKKKNIFVLMITDTASLSRMQHFVAYLQKISSKKVILLDGLHTNDDFIRTRNTYQNHYILINSEDKPTEFLLKNSQYVVNFVEKNATHFCLTSDVSTWKIENTARKIAKKTIGIALSSGGAPAVAHVGVLKVFREEGIPLDYIVGTSMGAAIGGGYAFGIPLETIMARFFKEGKKSWLERQFERLLHLSMNFSGLLRPSYYNKEFAAIVANKRDFKEALIPFAAVASDLRTGKTVVLNSGDVIAAIATSNAAPVIFEPIKSGNQLLIDGVATAPLPIQVLLDEEIDIKIAVSIPQIDLVTPIKKNPKLLAIYLRSRSMMSEEIINLNAPRADVIIKPQVNGISMNDWSQINKIIQAGEIAAHHAVKRIRYLLEGTLKE